ncbi:hypothetical protein [Sphingobium yanoikuyae]|uniref:hypothetical protein n=1 Tax=Sphingobium yanoikuyae TaxID=13690 RepID=UPI0031DEBAC8
MLPDGGSVAQIFWRRHSQFFDWLITPSPALEAFNAPEEEYFQSGNWEANEKKDAIEDKGTGIIYHHQFKTDDDHVIILDDVDAQLDNARQKFMYLREKTIRTMQEADQVYLLRYEWVSHAAGAQERFTQIRRIFGRYSDSISIVIASPNATEEILDGPDRLVKIIDGPTWGGDDASWNRIFSMIGAAKPAEQMPPAIE